MRVQGFSSLRGKRVLLLQGPVGPFFNRLGADLRTAGADVYKVNFNGGDWFFSSRKDFDRVYNYRGRPEDWDEYFRQLVKRTGVEIVMLFGDCRPIHREVSRISRECGVEVGVFEEGYLRPDYITLERNGVNSHSALPQDPDFFLRFKDQPVPTVMRLGSTFRYAALWAMLYYVMASLLKPVFWRYRHHRPLSWTEGAFWVLSYLRKNHYRNHEAGTQEVLCGPHSKDYFLVALQSCTDAQISAHSNYSSVEAFIEEVVRSFSGHAPADVLLVLKHHPLDRGYADYSLLIKSLAEQYGLAGRCYYIHDQHLPALLDHARGVVTINSTVGLSALQHKSPVKVCGRAIYDIKGLTFQGGLDQFWHQAPLHVPNPALYRGFKNYLVLHTQHNGSFYKQLPGMVFRSGINWTDRGDIRAITSVSEPKSVPVPMLVNQQVRPLHRLPRTIM